MSVTITGEDLSPAERGIRYELATLSSRLSDVELALGGVEAWISQPGAGGQLLGCWVTEHGYLGRVIVLRAFVDLGELVAERERAAFSTAPFGAADHLLDLSMDAFAPFPFVPPAVEGSFGAVYEIRDYHLRPGGLAPTLAAWRRALPARHAVHPLVLAMYGLDGPARIVHIWAYNGLDERIAIRRDLRERELWPPAGAPGMVDQAQSTIAFPSQFSPLR
jgi:hypothetical protein